MRKTYPLSQLPAMSLRWSLLASYLLHATLVLLVLQVSELPLSRLIARFQDIDLPKKAYYAMPILSRSIVFAQFGPSGPGGEAGRGANGSHAVMGTTVHHSNLAAVSNPADPDNNHQTIIQPNLPPPAPDTRITYDIRLPNVLLRGPAAPLPSLAPKLVLRELEDQAAAISPAAVAPTNSDLAQFKLLQGYSASLPTLAPKLTIRAAEGRSAAVPPAAVAPANLEKEMDLLGVTAVPLPSLAPKLVIRAAEGRTTAASPAAVAPANLALAQIDAPFSKPALVSTASTGGTSVSNGTGAAQNAGSEGPQSAQRESAKGGLGREGAPTGGSGTVGATARGAATGELGRTEAGAGGSGSLLALSADADDGVLSIALPPGNRLGAFSLSPGAAGPGSPGGSGKEAGAGQGGQGNGGDGSVTVAAMAGSGGGTASAALPMSVKGALYSGGADYGRGIYPVILPPHVRQKAWVISAGPSGGGGLEVYGALNCGRINTVFLPMSPSNWILQYCEAEGPARFVTSGRTTTITLPRPLLPPMR